MALLKIVPGINAALRDLGHAVDDDEDMDDASAPPMALVKKAKSKPAKANIEATSDEDED